jgi:two-component system chemotaxis response regulator CheB
VVIGSSTGGPPVLETIVCGLEAGWSLPVLIAQHMPGLFSRCLAERLSAMANVEVKIAESGERVRPGVVYIGEGGNHIRVVRGLDGMRLNVSPEPEGTAFKPSVNELFTSAARSYGSHVLGVVLTGMGDDGTIGASHLHAAGAPVLAQERSSCVVYGMPKCVVNAGYAVGVASPDGIRQALSQIGHTAAASGKRSA